MSAVELIAEQFKLAEFYLYELNQPDSALVIYRKVPETRNRIETQIDSLMNIIEWFVVEEVSPESLKLGDGSLENGDEGLELGDESLELGDGKMELGAGGLETGDFEIDIEVSLAGEMDDLIYLEIDV